MKFDDFNVLYSRECSLFHSHDLESVQVVFSDSSEQFLSCVPSVTDLVMTTTTTTMMMIIIIIIIIDTKPLLILDFLK